MARNEEIIEKDVDGNDISSSRIGAIRFRLMLRVVDRPKFVSQWQGATTVAEMAKFWDISENDVANLAKYLALAPKVRNTKINTTELAARIKQEIMDELKPTIKKMVDESIAEALK